MSVISDLIALLGPIVDDRVYPMGSEQSPVAPYITVFRVSAIEGNTLDTNGGTGNEFNTRMQIDCMAGSHGAAEVLETAIRTALKGWSVENVVLTSQDLFDDETRLHRVMIDISTWHY